MDKDTMMQDLARALNEKDVFNGAWLYAEKGEIVSKGAFGWVDAENPRPNGRARLYSAAKDGIIL